jgi:four helix bundle protein
MKVYSFEKLECWQQARRLAIWTYQSTKNFPTEERFGLTSQMRRASISVSSNIAEGSARRTSKYQAHFSTVAYRSTIELLNELIISSNLGYFTTALYLEGREMIPKQTLLISTLRNAQEKVAPKPLNS